jgi:hypothetical protein
MMELPEQVRAIANRVRLYLANRRYKRHHRKASARRVTSNTAMEVLTADNKVRNPSSRFVRHRYEAGSCSSSDYVHHATGSCFFSSRLLCAWSR